MSPAKLKAHNNRLHATRRAKERYGIDLSDADLAAIEEQVRSNAARPIGVSRTHEERTRYVVTWQDRIMLVIFDHRTDSLITFLPPDDLAFYDEAQTPTHHEAEAHPRQPEVEEAISQLGPRPVLPQRFSTQAEYDAFIAAARVRNGDITARRGLILAAAPSKFRQGVRKALEDDIARSVREIAAAKAMKVEIHDRLNVNELDIDPDDIRAVTVCVREAIGRMVRRCGGFHQLDEVEQKGARLFHHLASRILAGDIPSAS